MCMKASAQLMPPQRYARKQASDSTKYTPHMPRAVSAMRGVRRESFMGPGISALKICKPPRPKNGSTASASSMMPSPPISCKKQRQMLIEGASTSSPASDVAPVAVKPLMASK